VAPLTALQLRVNVDAVTFDTVTPVGAARLWVAALAVSVGTMAATAEQTSSAPAAHAVHRVRRDTRRR
jgi:hypothetical protein